MLPRFTLKIALLMLTVGAIFSVVLAAAWRGEVWGIGAVAAVVAAIVMLATHAVFFCFVRVLGGLALQGSPTPASPVQANPAQANPAEANPAQANPAQAAAAAASGPPVAPGESAAPAAGAEGVG